MTFQFTLYALPLLLSALIAIGLAGYSVIGSRRETKLDPTVLAFCVMMLANFVWSTGYGLQISSLEVDWKIFWFRLQQFGVMVLPPAWFVFALLYTGYQKWITRRILGLLAIEPTATYLILWFYPSIYTPDFDRVTIDGLVLVKEVFGPWYIVNVVYMQLLAITAIYFLFRMALTSRRLYRGQARALIVGASVPIVASILFVFHFTVVDFTSIGFTVSGVAFGYAIFRYRLLDLVPVARNRVVESMQDGFLVLDSQDVVVDLNPSAARLVEGTNPVGKPIDAVFPRVARLADGDPSESRQEEMTFEVDSDEQRFYQVSVSSLSDDKFEGSLVLLRDVTERAEVKRRFQELIENTSDLIVVLNEDATYRYLSPSVKRIMGYDPESLQGESALDYIHPEDLEAVQTELARGLEDPGHTAVVEHRFRHADGSWRTLESKGRSLLENPFVEGIVINARDVTERKQLEDKLRRQAQYDSLTGLPNRTLFTDRLETRLEQFREDPDVRFGVLYMDLDRFKTINDSLGHQAGDDLLQAVAGRLEAAVGEAATVARLGGDEFAVLLEELDAPDGALELAERINHRLEEPFELRNEDIFTRASLGVVVPEPGQYADTETLLRDADIAMYRSKNGSERYTLFEPGMHEDTRGEMKLEMQLQDALDNDELEVHYQPILRVDQEAFLGLEALVRWNHPERGYLTPGEFLPLAKKTGLMLTIDRWVLKQACRDLKRWRDQHPDMDLSVSVNCSRMQFMDPAFVDLVTDNLRSLDLDPRALYLEIAEGTIVSSPDRASSVINTLQEEGVHIVLDDFGTGYSSLSYLSSLPINVLKIDRAFVYQFPYHDNGHSGHRLVRAIMNMTESLDTRAITQKIAAKDHVRTLLTRSSNGNKTRGHGTEQSRDGIDYARAMDVHEVDEFIGTA